MRYAVIIEGEPGSYSGYMSNLPGCVACGDPTEEVLELMQEVV